jgi:predicted Zn-dependent protease
MGYWTYYLIWILVAYGARHPWLALGAVVFFALRRFIPDPLVWLQTSGRIRRLRQQIEANQANVTARRDLAVIYLQRLRPRTALKLLDEARQREPKDAELLYLTGLAKLRAGDAKGAIEPLVAAVDIDPRVRFGEPYLVAAEALVKLGILEEAADALHRYTHANTSSVEGRVRLALLERRRGDRNAAKEALREALSTWRQVPGYRRRKELRWWFRAQWARLVI